MSNYRTKVAIKESGHLCQSIYPCIKVNLLYQINYFSIKMIPNQDIEYKVATIRTYYLYYSKHLPLHQA